MKLKRIVSIFMAVIFMTVIVFIGCSKDKSVQNKKSNKHITNTKNNEKEKIDKEQYLNLILGSEPKTLDPSKVYDLYSSILHVNTMEALTRLEVNEDGKERIVPGAAKHWEVSNDGLKWTFKLRNMKWSDGVEVTAEQFVYGIARTLDAKTASPCGYLLFPIKNGEAFNSGKVDSSQLGVKAIDDKTLEITLEAPCAYFLNITYFKIMEPQRKDIIEKYGDKYGSEANTMIFTGPYKIKKWIHNNEIELEKNEDYWDKDSVKLRRVNFKIIKEENVRMNELLNGAIDIAAVSKQEWIEKFKATGGFQIEKGYDTFIAYTFFNQNDKYFKNAKIRKAFLLAEDRQGAVSTLFRNLAEPCYAWVPPAIYIGDFEFREKINYSPISELQEENKDIKALFIEGLKEEGLDADPSKHVFKLLSGGTDARSKEMAEFLQQNYNKILGVNVKCEYVEWPIFQTRTRNLDYQMALQGVGAEYNDPMTYFNMFISTTDIGLTGWKNEEFDNVIKEAGQIVNQEKRAELFKRAEEIFIYENAVISPIVWNFKNIYVRNYVKEYKVSTFGQLDLKKVYTEGRE